VAKASSKTSTKLSEEEEEEDRGGALDLDDTLVRPKEVAWRLIEGEALIVTPADSVLHTLNEVGTRIWELMDGHRTIREISVVLMGEFDVDAERTERDTVWFIERLARKGLAMPA